MLLLQSSQIREVDLQPGLSSKVGPLLSKLQQLMAWSHHQGCYIKWCILCTTQGEVSSKQPLSSPR